MVKKAIITKKNAMKKPQKLSVMNWRNVLMNMNTTDSNNKTH